VAAVARPPVPQVLTADDGSARRAPGARTKGEARLLDLLEQRRPELLRAWVTVQESAPGFRRSTASNDDLLRESGEVLGALADAVRSDGLTTTGAGYGEVRRLLADLSGAQARQGYSPSQTATVMFSLKDAVLQVLRSEGDSEEAIEGSLYDVNRMVDALGLVTFDSYVQTREQVIRSQHEELLELSTPVVKLWDGVLALPLVGTLDSQRTQMVMESLLASIVEHEASIAILDITGVPTVDTLVAQHLLKTVAATRLMGADCIISGIRPQIAQTIVSLGVELGEVTTKPSMAAALQVALQRLGHTVQRVDSSR
jgi:rsbT co-antagonist protein RsbR